MTMETKAWLKKTREVLEEFSSAEFQERVWLKGLGPEVSSYEEAMCRLFDDLGFNRLIDVEWRQAGLSEGQVIKLREFRDKLLEFDKDIPEIPKPTEVLQHHLLKEMRECALRAAQTLS